MPKKKILFEKKDVLRLLPHREPFQFVDCVTYFKVDKMIETELYLSGKEDFFRGHFPGKPLMPGVLVIDALAQTSGLLYGFSKEAKENSETKDIPAEIFFLVASNIKFVASAFPKDTIVMHSHFERSFGEMFSYKVEAFVEKKIIAKGTLTLARADKNSI